jgi:peptidoglycan hydrolase-like protein with peptidoglycan-binding domain
VPWAAGKPLVACGPVVSRGNPTGGHRPTVRGPLTLAVLGILTVPALAACSGSGGPDAAAAGPTSVAGSASPSAIAAPTTTVAPTTIAAPPSTPPATPAPTTAAPTTTTTTPLPPVSTLPPGPRNIEPIAALDAPLSAVGSSSGGETARIQQRLVDLNFWTGAVDGSYGLTTRQAVMAFQKYNGLSTSGSVDRATADAMTAATEQARAGADAGTLVEVDKSRQLLFFVVDGLTQWILNTSTANGQPYEEEDQNTPGEVQKGVAVTPNGLHKVNRERPVGWWEGDLGRIYRPKYVVGGVAVHGSNSVPDYPASHGCIRVSTQAMDFIWETGMMPMGIPVWIHGTSPV